MPIQCADQRGGRQIRQTMPRCKRGVRKFLCEGVAEVGEVRDVLQATLKDGCHRVQGITPVEQVLHVDELAREQSQGEVRRGMLLCQQQVGFDRGGTASKHFACQIAQVFDRCDEFFASLCADQVVCQVIPEVGFVLKHICPTLEVVGVEEL